MTATVEQVMQAYARQLGSEDRVHRQHHVPFSGQPGHYYFITESRPTSEQLAETSNLSGLAEVSLFGIEDFYCLYVGNPGGGSYAGTAGFLIPQQGASVQHFEWISHTHPLDAATSFTGMASGATEPDWRALDAVNQMGWQQEHSVVILCRGGQVEEVVRFSSSTSGPRTRQRAPSAPDAWFK